jgi:hypothetical protein
VLMQRALPRKTTAVEGNPHRRVVDAKARFSQGAVVKPQLALTA